MLDLTQIKFIVNRIQTKNDKKQEQLNNNSDQLRVYTFLFKTEKQLNLESFNAWALLHTISEKLDIRKNLVETYIIEYITQREQIVDRYFDDDGVYHKLHYKNLSKMLRCYYENSDHQ